MDELASLPSEDAPDWRWAVVRAMYDNGDPPTRNPDEHLFNRGLRFLRRIKKGRIVDVLAAKREYPDLYTAHNMHNNPASEKWIIEAGLLTNVSTAELGKYVAQPEEVITAYATYFFDVKAKLDSRGYIINRVLTPASQKMGINPQDPDFSYKSMAYGLGWEGFTEFIDRRGISDKLRGFLNTDFKDRLVKLGWMATHVVSLNNFTAIPIFEQVLKLMAMELQVRNEMGVSKDESLALMGALLNSCKVTILPHGSDLCLDEPRALEMIHEGQPKLSYGDPIPIERK
jgi:hypothetical protein